MDTIAPLPPPAAEPSVPPANPAGNATSRDDEKPALLEQQHAGVRSKHLSVRLDDEAGRFVQTWSDPTTHEPVRSYPSETQLAFSRAVSAYVRALTR